MYISAHLMAKGWGADEQQTHNTYYIHTYLLCAIDKNLS